MGRSDGSELPSFRSAADADLAREAESAVLRHGPGMRTAWPFPRRRAAARAVAWPALLAAILWGARLLVGTPVEGDAAHRAMVAGWIDLGIIALIVGFGSWIGLAYGVVALWGGGLATLPTGLEVHLGRRRFVLPWAAIGDVQAESRSEGAGSLRVLAIHLVGSGFRWPRSLLLWGSTTRCLAISTSLLGDRAEVVAAGIRRALDRHRPPLEPPVADPRPGAETGSVATHLPYLDHAADTDRLAEGLVAASRSRSRTLTVAATSAPGRGWNAAVKLPIEVLVDAAPGGRLLVTIEQPYKGPRPAVPRHVVDPATASSIVSVADVLEAMFAAWGADPTLPWAIEVAKGASELPVDEEWREEPSAGDLLDRLERLRGGRGGCVAISTLERPGIVVRLTASGRADALRVEGALSDLLATDERPRPIGRWRFRGPDRTSAAASLLRDVEAVLRGAAPGAGRPHEPSEPGRPTLAVRYEQRAAAAAVTSSGCATLTLVVCFTLFVAWGLLLLRWPMTGVFAELARSGAETDGLRKTGGGIIAVEMTLAVGGIAAYLLAGLGRRVMDRLRLPYRLEATLHNALGVVLYLVYAAAVVLTPFGAWALAASVSLFALAIGSLWLLAGVGWVLERRDERRVSRPPSG